MKSKISYQVASQNEISVAENSGHASYTYLPIHHLINEWETIWLRIYGKEKVER